MEVYEDLQNVADDEPLVGYDYLFHVQDRNARTPVTTLFFSEQNLTQLNWRIGEETGRLLNRKVQVVPNNGFFTYLEETLREAPNTYDPTRAVCNLNEMITKHEVGVQYRSLRRRELFFKWFFFKDRPRIISHPVDTHGRNRIEKFSNVDRALNNPDKKWWGDFQREQERIKCPNKVPELFSVFL